MNYIIGGGPAGLIAAAFFPKHKLVDKFPLGQLGLRFIAGPRIIKSDSSAARFIESVYPGVKVKTKMIEIGYEYQDGAVYTECDDKFKQEYSLITRGAREYKPSFLSSGEQKFEALTIHDYDPNEFYNILFGRLLAQAEHTGQLIRQKVKEVDTKNKYLKLGGEGYDMNLMYDELISTIRMDILESVQHDFQNLYTQDYSLLKKSFYKMAYDNPWEIELRDAGYSYIYGIHSVWTRKTYFKDYMVFETVQPSKILREKALDFYEDVPLQLKKNLNMKSFRDIKLLGRFAQWNHSIKANEVIKICEEWSS